MHGQHDPSPGEGPAPHRQGIAAYQEVWEIVRRGKWRILLLVVLGLAAGAAYGALTGPWYDSSAQMLVIKKRLDTTPISGPDQARAQEEYLSTHILLMTSRRVINRAIEKGDFQHLQQFRTNNGLKKRASDWVSQTLLGKTPDGPSETSIARDVVGGLVVGRDVAKPGINPSNEILNISFRGKVPEDCPRILDAIISSYQEFLGETYRNTNTETLELIGQARKMVQKDLEAKEAAYQKFLAETPPLWKGQDKITAQQDHLFKIEARRAALRLRRAEIEASVESIENAIKSGRNPAVLVGRMSGGPANADVGAPTLPAKDEPWFAERKPRVSLEEELIGLHLQEAKVLAVRAENHPEVLAVRRQIDNVRRMLATTAGESSGRSGRDLDLGKLKVELLKQELDDLKVAERSLSRLFEQEQQGVSAAYLHEIQDDSFRKGIERDRLLYESILQRLKEISTVRDFGGYDTQVIGSPLPGELAVKKIVLLFGLSLFCGLAAGFGWAYLASSSSRRIRSSQRLVPMANGLSKMLSPELQPAATNGERNHR
jgi:succinoglycan biosynthesis transport protein ExoP